MQCNEISGEVVLVCHSRSSLAMTFFSGNARQRTMNSFFPARLFVVRCPDAINSACHYERSEVICLTTPSAKGYFLFMAVFSVAATPPGRRGNYQSKCMNKVSLS